MSLATSSILHTYHVSFWHKVRSDPRPQQLQLYPFCLPSMSLSVTWLFSISPTIKYKSLKFTQKLEFCHHLLNLFIRSYFADFPAHLIHTINMNGKEILRGSYFSGRKMWKSIINRRITFLNIIILVTESGGSLSL